MVPSSTASAACAIILTLFAGSLFPGCNGYGTGGTDVMDGGPTFPLPVASPVLTPTGGAFVEPVTVRLSCETSEVLIRYSTDGTDPATGTVYDPNRPLQLSVSSTVRAIAVAVDGRTSTEVSADFAVLGSWTDPNEAGPGPDPADLAPISVFPQALNLGCLATSRTLTITCRKEPPVEWQLQTDPAAPWLKVALEPQVAGAGQSLTGTADATVTVTVDRTGLAKGTHSAQLTLSCGSDVLSIPVFVSVSPSDRSSPFDAWTAQTALKAENGIPYRRMGGMVVSPCGRFLYASATDALPDDEDGYEDFYFLVIRTSDQTIEKALLIERGVRGMGPGLVGVSPDGRYVYLESGSKVFRVLRTSDWSVVAEIPDTLGDLLVDPTGRYVYVTNYLEATITVIRTSDFRIAKVIDPSKLEGHDSRQAVRAPSFLAITPDGKEMYVALCRRWEDPAIEPSEHYGTIIAVIETTNHTVIQYINVPGMVSDRQAGVTPDGQTLYTTLSTRDGNSGCGQVEELMLIRTRDHTVQERIRLADQKKTPHFGVWVSPDGQYVYVDAGDRILVIRAGDHKALYSIICELGPSAMMPNGARMYRGSCLKKNGELWLGVIEEDPGTLPKASVSAEALDFGYHETQTTFQIRNIGTGLLQWEITKEEPPESTETLHGRFKANGTAIHYTNDNYPPVKGTGESAVTISLDRKDLPNSIYREQIRISDGWREWFIPTLATACPGGADYLNMIRAWAYQGQNSAFDFLGSYFGTVIAAPVRNVVYVTLKGPSNGRILAVQVPDFTILNSVQLDGVRTYNVPGNGSLLELAVSPDGEQLFVSNPDADSVVVVRTRDFQILGQVLVGPVRADGARYEPSRIVFTADGQYAYVMNKADSSVSVIRVSDRVLVSRIGVTGTPCSIVAASGNIYVLSRSYDQRTQRQWGLISVIRPSDNAVTATVSLDIRDTTDTSGMTTSPDGSRIYIEDSTKVWEIQTADNRAIPHSVGDESWLGDNGLGFSKIAPSPDGRYLYLLGGQLFVVRTSDYTIADKIMVPGQQHEQMAFTSDGAYLVVAGSGLAVVGQYPGDDSWVTVSPQTLEFGATDSQKTIQLINHGPRNPDWSVSMVSRVDSDHPASLQVTMEGTQIGGVEGNIQFSGRGGATLTVRVDRTHMVQGVHNTVIHLLTESRRIMIPVTVDNNSPPGE